MTVPLAVLAGGCIAAAVVPGILLRLLKRVVSLVLAGSARSPVPDFDRVRDAAVTVSVVNVAIGGAILVVALAWRSWLRVRQQKSGPTWGCGYVGAPARAEYTARSFAELDDREACSHTPLGPHVSSVRPRGDLPAVRRVGSRRRPTIRLRVGSTNRRSRDQRIGSTSSAGSSRASLQLYIVYMLRGRDPRAGSKASFGGAWA